MKSIWIEYVNQKSNDSIYTEFYNYLFFLTEKQLIDLWDYPKNKIALRNFVNYFYSNGNYLINKNNKVNLYSLLNKPNLIQELEEEFFRIEQKDEKYSNEISIVLQMIESIEN